MTINEIFDKYGTDKGSIKHNYGPFYERWLPKNPRKILEIGVLDGASLRAWREIFPDAEIHGLDLFSVMSDDRIYYLERELGECKLWKGDQTDKEILHLLRKENFDVIIDDGSHNTREVMMTFFGLAHEGCKYFIEDVYCMSEAIYNQGLPKEFWPSGIFSKFSSIWDFENNIYLIQC